MVLALTRQRPPFPPLFLLLNPTMSGSSSLPFASFPQLFIRHAEERRKNKERHAEDTLPGGRLWQFSVCIYILGGNIVNGVYRLCFECVCVCVCVRERERERERGRMSEHVNTGNAPCAFASLSLCPNITGCSASPHRRRP